MKFSDNNHKLIDAIIKPQNSKPSTLLKFVLLYLFNLFKIKYKC